MTTMQELIEFIYGGGPLPKRNTGEIIDKCEELLVKEREQIEAAYCEGCKDTYGNDEPDPKKPDSYYAGLYYDINYNKQIFGSRG